MWVKCNSKVLFNLQHCKIIFIEDPKYDEVKYTVKAVAYDSDHTIATFNTRLEAENYLVDLLPKLNFDQNES